MIATDPPGPVVDEGWRLWLPDGLDAGFHAETPGHPGGLVHVGRSWATPSYDLPRHAHDGAWELYAQLQGTARFTVGGRPLHVAPGWLYAVPPGMPHGYQGRGAGQRNHFAYAAFDAGRVGRRHPALAAAWAGRDVLATAEGHQVQGPLRALVAEVAEARPFAALAVDAALDLVLVAAARALLAPGAARPRTAVHPAVVRARDLLDGDPARAWTVPALADAVGMSRSQLAGRFARETGETPAAYLARVRVERAADLLRTTARSVAEIAAEAGFSSAAVLARAFRAHLGTTPSRWRAGPREEEP